MKIRGLGFFAFFVLGMIFPFDLVFSQENLFGPTRSNVLQNTLEEQTKTKERIQETLQTRLAEKEEKMREKKESFFQEIQKRNEESWQKAKEKQEEFQLRLRQIKDERKRNLVERINQRILMMNQDYTRKFASVLDKLQSILERISQKAEEIAPEGQETTALKTAIDQAELMIKVAREKVAAQALKQYLIQLPQEERGLKDAVGQTVSQFRNDLRDVWQAVIKAKQAVSQAAKELAKVLGEIKINKMRPRLTPTLTGEP